MNNKFIAAIIKELGPVGILVLGLYLTISTSMDKLVKNMEQTNTYLEKITYSIRVCETNLYEVNQWQKLTGRYSASRPEALSPAR